MNDFADDDEMQTDIIAAERNGGHDELLSEDGGSVASSGGGGGGGVKLLESIPSCEGGSDSGVEMQASGKCCHCRSSNLVEGGAGSGRGGGSGGYGDSETDSYVAGGGSSLNGHSPMYFGGADDVCDLVSSTRKLSIGAGCGGDVDANGEHSLVSYDAASENGSESSSLDDSKKCKSNCVNAVIASKMCAYDCGGGGGGGGGGGKSSRRQATMGSSSATSSGRAAKTPFSHDSLKFCSNKASCKGASGALAGCGVGGDFEARYRGVSGGEVKTHHHHGLRSCSGTRVRTPLSPDEAKWSDTCRSSSRNRLLPNGGGGGGGSSAVMERITTYEAYATMPRRKQKDAYNALESRNTPREPSLNRAASLRKKFLENSLMTSSYNGSLPSPSQPVKTMPPYVKPKSTSTSSSSSSSLSPSVKTKIYHEASTQTLLTNSDVDHTLSEHPFEMLKNLNIEADGEYLIKRRYEDQLASVGEELKKIKKENSKQRTVIEWLEGELSSSKDEKSALQNKLASIEQRIYSLLRHKGSSEDVFHQLEREVSYNNNVISQLQEEIGDLQQMCRILKEDLNKSYSVQKTIIEAQKVTEVESMELQEFLQAEKSTLSDSLRDAELELKTCMTRLNETEHELAEKKNEFSNLQSKCDQQREENESIKERLTNLERRCRELLLYQGAAISSASVAISGLSSRFEQLLDQLYTLYSISDADLQTDTFLITILGDEKKEDDLPTDFQIDGSRLKLTRTWLKAISNIITKTSAEKHENSNSGGLMTAPHDSSNSINLSKENGLDMRRKAPSDSEQEGANKRDSVLNLITSDDALFSPKLDFDGRRNSMLMEIYAGVDNLALDFGISDAVNDSSKSLTTCGKDKLNGISILKDFNGQDVSVVEQINEIDKLVTKVFKAILLTQSCYFSKRKIVTNENKLTCNQPDETIPHYTQSSTQSLNENVSVQNGSSVPNGGDFNSDALTCLRLQNKAINNALSKLHQMQETVDESAYLKKIQTELETVSEKSSSFLSALHY